MKTTEETDRNKQRTTQKLGRKAQTNAGRYGNRETVHFVLN